MRIIVDRETTQTGITWTLGHKPGFATALDAMRKAEIDHGPLYWDHAGPHRYAGTTNAPWDPDDDPTPDTSETRATKAFTDLRNNQQPSFQPSRRPGRQPNPAVTDDDIRTHYATTRNLARTARQLHVGKARVRRTLELLDQDTTDPTNVAPSIPWPPQANEDERIHAILTALRAANGDLTHARQLLGIGPTTFNMWYRAAQRQGLTP